MLVDKPKGLTSNDVVNEIRRVYHLKKVGHAGTLDPLATGLLVVGLGKATRLFEYLKSNKTYVAEITLGATSETLDSEGPIVKNDKYAEKGIREVKDALETFKGKQEQIPPVHSAIKINGQAAYKRTRNNEKLEMKSRQVEFFQIELLDYKDDVVKIQVEVSAGTYIRSLARDIGEKLGTGAYMSNLQRIKSGDFDISNAMSLEDIQQEKEPTKLLIPIEKGVSHLPKIEADEEMWLKVIHGQTFGSKTDGNLAQIWHKEKLIAIAIKTDDLWQPNKVLV